MGAISRAENRSKTAVAELGLASNPKPSPVFGPFFRTEIWAENGFFFVGLLRARCAAAAAQLLARCSLLWHCCWHPSGLKAARWLPAFCRCCREPTVTQRPCTRSQNWDHIWSNFWDRVFGDPINFIRDQQFLGSTFCTKFGAKNWTGSGVESAEKPDQALGKIGILSLPVWLQVR